MGPVAPAKATLEDTLRSLRCSRNPTFNGILIQMPLLAEEVN